LCAASGKLSANPFRFFSQFKLLIPAPRRIEAADEFSNNEYLDQNYKEGNYHSWYSREFLFKTAINPNGGNKQSTEKAEDKRSPALRPFVMAHQIAQAKAGYQKEN
jgi:hypothetical protein